MWSDVDTGICELNTLVVFVVVQGDLDDHIWGAWDVIQAVDHGLVDVKDEGLGDTWTVGGQVDRGLREVSWVVGDQEVTHLERIEGLDQVHLVDLCGI